MNKKKIKHVKLISGMILSMWLIVPGIWLSKDAGWLSEEIAVNLTLGYFIIVYWIAWLNVLIDFEGGEA